MRLMLLIRAAHLWMQLGVEETRNYEFGHNR
jgi:hypothetical protein